MRLWIERSSRSKLPCRWIANPAVVERLVADGASKRGATLAVHALVRAGMDDTSEVQSLTDTELRQVGGFGATSFRYWRSAFGPGRSEIRRARNAERDEAIRSERAAGRTLEDIGQEYALTRERVRQIVAKEER